MASHLGFEALSEQPVLLITDLGFVGLSWGPWWRPNATSVFRLVCDKWRRSACDAALVSASVRRGRAMCCAALGAMPVGITDQAGVRNAGEDAKRGVRLRR